MAETTRNLNDEGPKAFQALLQSLAPELQNEPNMTPETLQKLSGKMTELLGEDAAKQLLSGAPIQPALNEEGLPILEITEPVTGADATVLRSDDLDLLPLKSLPVSERDRKRRERDRILDLLEAEEQAVHDHALDDALARRQDAIRKQEESSMNQTDRLKAQREMQKKMGKALIRNITQAKEREEEAARLEQESLPVPQSRASFKKKKSVTFSEKIDIKPDSPATPSIIEWGDVVPGRLRPSTRPSVVSKSTLPMKSSVVERLPSTPAISTRPLADSDDESEPPTSESESELELDHDAELEDELDFDMAQHQREIALEYHQKRKKLGVNGISLVPDGSLEEELSPHGKPVISRFKATRLAASFNTSNPDGQSLTGSVVPETAARTIQNSIRLGKLDEKGQLVGEDSDEETEEAREIMELLRKGEVFNAGPDGHAPSARSSAKTELPSVKPLPPRASSSKFKLSRGQNDRPSSAQTPSAMSMIIESPSFPSPHPSTAFSSMIIESPSFPSAAPSANPSRRPVEPPTVMASTVRESRAVSDLLASQGGAEGKPKKMSRFMLDRS
ncbi:hypothetical protein C8J56DRAFT_956275 [Mycena floridula]|nr:hypothetical protein C8J56DRAFT_956275 [Mycena floridula]